MTEKKVYTTGEAARICNLSQMTIIRNFENGILKGFKEPEKNLRRIFHDSLLAFMREKSIPLCQDRTISITVPGLSGIGKILQIITRFETAPPSTIAGMQIIGVKECLNQPTKSDDEIDPLTEPNEYMFMIELDKPDHYVAIKPLEIKPKRVNLPNIWLKPIRIEMVSIIKFHLVTHLPLSEFQDIEAGIAVLQSRLDAMESDVREMTKLDF